MHAARARSLAAPPRAHAQGPTEAPSTVRALPETRRTLLFLPYALRGSPPLHARVPQRALQVLHLAPHPRAAAGQRGRARLEAAPAAVARGLRGRQQRLERLARQGAEFQGSGGSLDVRSRCHCLASCAVRSHRHGGRPGRRCAAHTRKLTVHAWHLMNWRCTQGQSTLLSVVKV